jgi:HD-GYP domain-containing protein (c-di-GMP phosphodiesterase class II)
MPNAVRPRQLSSTVATRLPRTGRRGAAVPEAPSIAADAEHAILRSRPLAPSIKQFVQVTLATLLVAGCPIAIVWWLRASGAISSAVVCVLLGMSLSLGASHLSRVLWEKWPGSEDVLFSELMIWGYLHRLRTQHRLASALDTLGPMSQARRRALDGMSTKDRAKLLEQLVAEMETRDPYLHGHSRRVARYSWMIARGLGLPPAEVARIRTAAAIHDVGKIKTPTAILHKPGRLTDEEYEVIKKHPGDGAQMAGVLRDPELTAMVRHHHERLDGTGYPDGQSGQEIPLGARIIAVADTFDAITSERPYRPASPHKRAIDILKVEAGTRLDPDVVRAFCRHYAGRRPLALWAIVAGLPERVLAWFGGSAASVASAVKVMAAAALVGGAAVSSATLGLPVAKHHSAATRSGSRPGPRAQLVSAASRNAFSAPNAAATPNASSRSRHAARTGAVAGGVQTSGGAGVEPTAGGDSPQGAGTGAGDSVAAPKSESPSGKTEASPTKAKAERPSKGKGEESATKSKGEETSSKDKGEETSSKDKGEESTAKGKGEESATKSKGEETSSKDKSDESTTKKGEETLSKGKQSGGKVEEVLGKTKEVVKEVTGKVEGVLGKLK